jgi:hypothetical protein
MKSRESLAISVAPSLVHIQVLSEQLNQIYQAMKAERQTISRWEEEQEFSILGVMELFSSDIQGYVEQLLSNHPGNSLDDRAIFHLRQLDAFSINYFTDWYFANLEAYPQTQQYIEQLDHLRLLLIECFRERSPAVAPIL